MTNESPVWRADPPTCRFLRSKQYYMDLPFHSSGMDSGVEVPCWCFHTMKTHGPDANPASQAACTPGRSCFEER